MKTYLHAFLMCQSMFCAIPFPCRVWDEKAREKMLVFLPVVGLEMGLLWFLVGQLCRYWDFPLPVTAFLLTAWPYFVTGFLHLDGFMDVTDAVKSCRDLPRRREILKDSHVGSFSVIGCILLMLGQFAFFWAAAPEADLRVLILVPAVSRCGSALSVSLLKSMSTSQFASQRPPRSQTAAICILLGVFLILGFLLFRKNGLVLLAEAAVYLLALHRGYRSLEGMNGDIAGYSLTLSELAAVAALSIL